MRVILLKVGLNLLPREEMIRFIANNISEQEFLAVTILIMVVITVIALILQNKEKI